MGLLDVYNAQIKQRGEPGEPPTAGDAAWDAAQTGWDYISAPLRGLGYVTEQALAGPVRSALGAIEGAPAEQQPIFFGLANVPVPTGRQLLEPLGVPPNDPSRWEVADVAGGAVDVLTDPTTYVGIGAMTKAGKLASRASALAREAEALSARAAVNEGPRAAALLAERAKIQQLLTGVEGELQALGAPNRLAPTWAEQGKLGQRTALSYPGIGGIGGERSLAAMAKVGQAVSSPFRRLYDEAFRVKGEFAGRLGVEDAARLEDAYTLSQDVRRGSERVGREELKTLAAQLQNISKSPVDLPAVRGAIAPEVDALRQRLATDHAAKLQSIDTKIAAAQAAGDDIKAAQLIQRRVKAEAYHARDLLAADPLTGYSSTKPAQTGVAATKIAAFLSDVPQKIDDKIVDATARTQAKVNAAQQKIATLQAAGAPSGFGSPIAQAQARITRLNNNLAARIAKMSLKKDVAASTLALLPAESRDWAVRYLALGGRVLENDVAHGVPVTELSDPFVSYVHRVTNPNALAQAEAMRLTGADNAFTRAARQANPAKGFTIERTPFFDGLTHGQINEWWRSVGGKGDFVSEDIVDSALRRIVSGAEGAADAEFLRAGAQMFHVPAAMAKPGDVPMENFLSQARVAKLGDEVLKTGRKWSTKDVAKALENTPLHGTYVPRQVANEMLRTQKVLTNPVEMGRIGTFIQEAQNMVRWGFTQPFAGFHVKNRTGNWFVMALAGMRDPRWVWRARQSLTRAEKGAATAAEMASINEAIEKGALGGLQTTADIVKPGSAASKFAHFFEELGPRTGRAIGGKPGEAIGSLGRKYLQTGTRWELEDKYALYMWAKSQGKSPTEAARIVREYLFDYGELSQFEKKWLRPMAFFYSWQRKAFPLLARKVAQNPGLGTAFNRMTGGVGDSSQSRDLQPYQINRGSFPIGDSTYFTPDLPIFTLNRYGSEGRGFGRTAQQVGGQLAPIPAAMLQMATGMDLQRGKPLSGGIRGALETLLPTARLTRSLSTASDVLPADASPAEYALRTAGLSVYRTSPERRMRNRLAEISASQQRLAESGREQPSFAYSAKSQAGKDLAKERARIIAALKKVSQ